MKPANSEFLPEVHAFRSFAITCVVALHVLTIFHLGTFATIPASFGHDLLLDIYETLFHGSTLYFAFISGLLFTRVLAHKGWPQFFRNKFLYVFLPYTGMTLLFTAVPYQQLGLQIHWQGPEDFVRRFIVNLALGKAMLPYWYIPQFLCLCLLTPLVVRLVRSSTPGTALLVLLPLLISRTETKFSIESILYFLGAYAAGIYLGMDYDKKLTTLRAYRPHLLLFALGLSGVVFTLRLTQVDRFGSVSLQESLIYMLRITLSLALLTLLGRSRSAITPVVNALAEHAFSIYFLHSVVVVQTALLVISVVPPITTSGYLLVISLAATLLALLASLVIGMAIKKASGRYSRMIIGA